MDSLLGALGLLFFMFLVLAAAVEVILEMFRGTLERFGITWAAGKVSLDDALKLAAEFAPNDADVKAKADGLVFVNEPVETQAMFREVWGDYAPEQWALEHNTETSR